MSALPSDANGREMAEDDGPDPQRLSAPTRFPTEATARLVHPPCVQLTTGHASPQGHAAVGWTAYCTSAIRRRSCRPAVQRKASDSNATVSPAHPLATEPGAPGRFTFRTEPRIRTANLLDLNQAPLPLG
jgi:hypothetical protein